MNKSIYRIEIKNSFGDKPHIFWIGKGLELVQKIEDAIPVTHEEHLELMQTIDIIATDYRESPMARKIAQVGMGLDYIRLICDDVLAGYCDEELELDVSTIVKQLLEISIEQIESDHLFNNGPLISLDRKNRE